MGREVKIFTYIKDFVAIFFNSHEKAREIESLREENVRLNNENATLREELNPRRGLVIGEYGVLWNEDDRNDRNQPYCPNCVFGHNRRTPLNREGEAWRCPVRECGEAYNWNPPDIQDWPD